VFEILSAATSLETLALRRARMIEPIDKTSLLARFPSASILRTLNRLQVDASSVFLNPIRWITLDLPITELDLQDVLESSAVDAASFFASCGKGVIHLSLRFSDLGLSISTPEGVFIRSGGLSHNPSLLTLHLGAEHSFIIPILDQVASPRLRAVVLRMTPYTLVSLGSDLEALEALFASRFTTATLEIVGTHDAVEPLIIMREALFARMSRLREEGRLNFRRSDGLSMDPDATNVLDMLLEE